MVHGIYIYTVNIYIQTWRDEVRRLLAQKGDSFTRFVMVTDVKNDMSVTHGKLRALTAVVS